MAARRVVMTAVMMVVLMALTLAVLWAAVKVG